MKTVHGVPVVEFAPGLYYVVYSFGLGLFPRTELHLKTYKTNKLFA